MRAFVSGAALALVVGLASAGSAKANILARACMQADRPAATAALCGCIQAVADRILSNQEQRLAAEFFSDPHRAQVIRQSDNRGHEVFWERYKVFGSTAEEYCSG